MSRLLPEAIRSKLSDALHLSKPYTLIIAEPLQNSYEDPKCPSNWRNSGCYDIDIFAWGYHRVELNALTLRQALQKWEKNTDKEYIRVFNEQYARLAGKAYAQSFAREMAHEKSLKGCEVIGAFKNKHKEGQGDPEVVDSRQTDWTPRETEPDLDEAIRLLNLEFNRKSELIYG